MTHSLNEAGVEMEEGAQSDDMVGNSDPLKKDEA